jgi:hypothetical protein
MQDLGFRAQRTLGDAPVWWVLVAGAMTSACGDSPRNDCSASLLTTRDAFVPEGQAVHNAESVCFEVGERTVHFTHVEYGELRDCPSGCFSSHVCGVEDPAQSAPLLFYAAWNSQDEQPIGIAAECPTLMSFETWPDCVPSGLRHPLVSTGEFRRFADRESGSGPFRWCVNRYTADGAWP